MSDYKIAVTKAGKNVSSTSGDDYYMHSDYPLLKVHASGSFTTLNNGTKTIDHDLGYIPFVLVFSQYMYDDFFDPVLTDEYYQHDWLQQGSSVDFYGFTKIFDDRIEITVGNSNFTTISGGVDGFYYIFKNDI